MAKTETKKEKSTKTEAVLKADEPKKLAVIELSGHQYLVKEGENLTIDNQNLEPGKKFKVAEVLLLESNGEVLVGQPYVSGGSVELEVLENKKGEKIEVMKYKAKSRYHKHIGYRSSLTEVKVVSVK